MQSCSHPEIKCAVKDAFGLVAGELNQVKELIRSLCTMEEKCRDTRYDIRETVCSGKMLRPALVLLAGNYCGKITEKHIHVAAMAEMIHNATLLHDDVIDEGQKRRRQPTINSLYGNESAVLLGDFLLSRVFGMCADLEPQIISIIASAAARTCGGELRQVSQRRNWQLNESEYLEIITEKSAVLFSCCCELGGLLAGAGETEVKSLADFGLNVGIAFQIADDLLDITGDEKKTGKTAGSDVDKNKLTLPIIHLLGQVDEKEKAAVIKKLEAAMENRKGLVELLRAHGSLEYACGRAKGFAAKAIEGLAGLKENKAKKGLIEIAEFVVSRAA